MHGSNRTSHQFMRVLAALSIATFAAGVSPVRAQDTGAIGPSWIRPGPGWRERARREVTGESRTAVTVEGGRYRIPALQPSRYSVTAELTGFSTVRRPEVTVNIGFGGGHRLQPRHRHNSGIDHRHRRIAADRGQEDRSQQRHHAGHLSIRFPAGTGIGRFRPAPPRSPENVTTIQGTGTVVGGARSKEGSLLVDGFYNLDETFAMPKTRHSQDSIQEFQVVTFGGAAEYGCALGGSSTRSRNRAATSSAGAATASSAVNS